MQCYTELVPPTAVTHAVQLPFLAPKSNNLVVSKASLLQIFELKSTVTEVSPEVGDHAAAVANFESEVADVALQRTEHTSKLVVLGEYPVAGTITALTRIKVRGTKSGAEALLIAFRDAKLSLVEWDPEVYGLNTISIHYYEEPEMLEEPWAADLSSFHNFLTTDPSSRCAALKFGPRNLAILPFKQPDEDLVMDDYSAAPREPNTKTTNGDTASSPSHGTPYAASFVLSLTMLDPALTHPVHLAFLHEYREPTFGVLSASRAVTAPLLSERKDILTYTVFTLDLEQKASTTLLSVSGIPYDVSRILPLPSPVGGALLIGNNEIIHVDQSGKSRGISVNEFAKTCTNFVLEDQSELNIGLEGCVIELISYDTGDVLIVLNNGDLLTLTFTLDGRTVSRMGLHRVDESHGGRIIPCRASCAATLGRGRMFIGSEEGDSVLLGWTNKDAQNGGINDSPELSENEDMEEDLVDDDLYGDTAPTIKKTRITTAARATPPGSYTFRLHDILSSLAPIKDVTSPEYDSTQLANENSQPMPVVDILAATGKGRAGALTILTREVHSTEWKRSTFDSARGLWSIHTRRQAPKGLVPQGANDIEGNLASDAEYDQYLVVCKAGVNGNEDTIVYQINDTEIEETSKGDFEREDGSTMNVGVLAGGTTVVQVLRSEIRTYDSELNMDQIIPMEDEETGAELRIINASFVDPYLLVLRDDSTVKLFKASGSSEVEEVESAVMSSFKWMSSCLYRPSKDPKPYAFLLTPEGGLHVFSLSDLSKPSYVAEGLCFLPGILTADYTPRRSSAKAAIVEILVADLGNATTTLPHLIIRTANDDLAIYKPFYFPARPISDSQSFTINLRWLKLPQQHLPKYTAEPALDTDDAGRESTLMAFENIGGYSTVFQRGTSPCFIFQESSSVPRVISLSGKAVKGLTAYHTVTCERGFAYIDVEDTLRIAQLPANTRFGDIGWATRKLSLGQEVHAVRYHPRGIYVLGTGTMEKFYLPEDTHHPEWAREDIAFRPQVERGMVQLMDARTWSIIDTTYFEPREVVLCVEVLNLEISEVTHERKPVVCVGTGVVHGEDQATMGCMYVFEVITVVPEPGRPETNRRLRLLSQEKVKGAVTAVSALGNQGFMIMAQGQKCMVRGLKEDGTLLPVAFMDMQCYVTVLKSLDTTGLVLMGDAFSGLWFTGYTEEPYKMMLFGKSRSDMEIMAADFLPFERQLHFIIADADCNLHVLQFDPDQPKSLSGHRLLHKSTFHVGHFPTTLSMHISSLSFPQSSEFPSISASPGPMDMDDHAEHKQPLRQLLHTTQSGSIGLITPVPESTYRRLNALATFMANSLESPCGMNPRAYRAVEGEWGGGAGTRGIIDGGLLMRWGELGEQKKAEGLGKVGVNEWVFNGEREVLVGLGLFGGVRE